jgi:3-ketoacyl-CoA synthase
MPNLLLLAPSLSTLLPLLLLPGGYAVLKGVQEGMKLPSSKMLASFASLRDYGNTSCSTTWYVLAYLETCEKVKRGQTVMQVRGRAASGDGLAQRSVACRSA